MTLREVLADAAAGARGSRASGDEAAMVWSVRGVPFATLSADGSAAEFALDPAVAAAATRTPDTTASGRGPGWVRFHPGTVDDHAADRARAWFLSAHRNTSG